MTVEGISRRLKKVLSGGQGEILELESARSARSADWNEKECFLVGSGSRAAKDFAASRDQLFLELFL